MNEMIILSIKSITSVFANDRIRVIVNYLKKQDYFTSLPMKIKIMSIGDHK